MDWDKLDKRTGSSREDVYLVVNIITFVLTMLGYIFVLEKIFNSHPNMGWLGYIFMAIAVPPTVAVVHDAFIEYRKAFKQEEVSTDQLFVPLFEGPHYPLLFGLAVIKLIAAPTGLIRYLKATNPEAAKTSHNGRLIR